MLDVDRAMSYLGFVEARHRAWVARQHGDPQPWTSEPIVATRKFTNVFRVLDHGSQYVFNLIDEDPATTLMRLFLYRHTGRVEVWEYLEMTCGLPTLTNLDDVLAAFKTWRGKTTVKTFMGKSHAGTPHKIERTSMSSERPIFTGAYLVFPQSQERGTDKIDAIVNLTRRLFIENPIDPDFLAARTQSDRFNVLRRNKGVADFMSMQILTDWGYTPHAGADREDEFVVLGPGALKGAKALAPGWDPVRTHLWAVDAVRASPRCPELWTEGGAVRLPSWMDVQNTLCEFSKWVRYADKPLPEKQYKPAHPGRQDPPVLPEHW